LLHTSEGDLNVRGKALPEGLGDAPVGEVRALVVKGVAIARAKSAWCIDLRSAEGGCEALAGRATALVVLGEGGIVVSEVERARVRHGDV
jgi:chemotaxis signal transduction protein